MEAGIYAGEEMYAAVSRDRGTLRPVLTDVSALSFTKHEFCVL